MLYETPGGNVPKDLLNLCFEMDDLFLNFPESRKAKRTMDRGEYARLRKGIERASKVELHKLTRTKRFAMPRENLFLLKERTTSNPRLYFTDILHGYLIFLHGIKKKEYAEDPQDIELSLERIGEIESGQSLSHFR